MSHSLKLTPAPDSYLPERFMPIQAIKIPQNVYIEDRIVGPLTLKQILIVGVGVGFSYALYGMLTKAYGALPLPITIAVWVPAGIAAIFAFVRINDISMFRLMLLAIERLNKPSTRVWTPRRGITINVRTFSTPQDEKKTKVGDAKVDMQTMQFDELSAILDQSRQKKSENVEGVEELEELSSESSESSRLPVDPSRVMVSTTTNGSSMDTVSAPVSGSISLFRDLSPHV